MPYQEHIKIYDIPPRIQYVANGTSKKYEFPFAVFDATNLRVYFDDELQTDDTYAIVLNPQNAGGSVTFHTPPPTDKNITLARQLDIERITDFMDQSAIRPETLNYELDYQIACTQQITDAINRSMVLPVYAPVWDTDMTLPYPQAGKAIVWSADGKRLENSDIEINSLTREIKEYADGAKQSSSELIGYASAAKQSAETAREQAGISAEQADIATQKANEIDALLASKANADLSNVSGRFVAEFWKSTDGMTWFRKWSDGFIEQGGFSGPSATYFNLATPFSNTNYTLLATCAAGGNYSNSGYMVSTNNKTVSSFQYLTGFSGWSLYWYAAGF